MLLVIDNYDSFTWNLVHYLGELGAEPEVVRNDRLTAEDALGGGPEAIVLSPGPCTPTEAGVTVPVIQRWGAEIPTLGVCLGHQAIGQAFGGKVVRAPKPMHGKLSRMRHDADGVFAGLANPFEATRYHSLLVDRATLPDCLAVTAETEDGLIMGLEHRGEPIYGVQFHPESIASQGGHRILGNFLRIATNGRLPSREPAPLPPRRVHA